ncbi:monovalent cation/H+ antiporter subunit D family protein [Paraglaciecola aquimarina]|uniref:Monovalent cation/H+ antiporter subunit D family protein n=1 Tax=Paraglaciecola algarum TaxID=3050085 RepID=A0ABS9DAY8_9ALTE|nr:monovalent cation/H+ antiporter subunit D family protein [Paraglaciecola sp. G1-23]MCF2949192.1 monovalent cation/H+ antiporter subunit D family protein [Paraglaciecola sp. G1-23]
MDLLAHLPALQVIVPMLSAPLIVLLQPRGLAWAGATAVALLSFAIAVSLTLAVLDGQTIEYAMGGWPAPYGIALSVDAFSALMLLVVTGASTAALLAAKPSIDKQIELGRQPLFYSAWLLVLSGLVGIVVAADAFNIFVFMEISSLASYILIAGGPDRRALPAVFKYLIMGTIGATFYLIGVGLIYMMTGTLNLADMEARIGDVVEINPVLVAAGFITIGLALKAAVFPLHVWVPNAYTHAPHMVTVFLAACATKVSLYVLIRFDYMVFQSKLVDHDMQFAMFAMPLAILGILVASAVAMFEGHLKRLLASSSVAQIGYILLGASLVSVIGLSASATHLFNHALAKGGLFLAVACLAYQYKDLRLDQLGGASTRMPWTCAAFVVCGLSLIGVPGTAGFISKWLLINAALQSGPWGWGLVAIILISSLMAVVYIWRIVEALYFNDPVEDDVLTSSEAPLQLLLITGLVAILNIYFGIFPQVPLELANSAAALLMEGAK